MNGLTRYRGPVSEKQNAVKLLELFAHPPRKATVAGATVVALDGRSGAGKTRLAAAVIGLDPSIKLIAIENFYHGWTGLSAGPVNLIRQVLRPWAAGLPAQARYWDWHRGTWARELTPLPFPTSGRVLIEGCGAGARALSPFTSGLAWIDAAAPVRFDRAMARDGAMFAPHWDRWAQQEEDLIATDQAPRRADLILSSV